MWIIASRSKYLDICVSNRLKDAVVSISNNRGKLNKD